MKKFWKIFVLIIVILGVLGTGGYLSYHYLFKERPVDFSTVTYVALGDSITFAMDGTKGGAPMSKPYCEVVKETLGLKSVTNYGISASTICTENGRNAPYQPMCQRYASMEDADIVSVMGGTNDWGRLATLGTIEDTQSSTFYGALKILCSGLKEKYPNSFIFFMTPLKCRQFDGREDGEEFDAFRQAIKDVCAKFDIPVLDTANLADFSQEYLASDYNGDGVHPSEEFHKTVLAPVISKFIKDNYKGKDNA